MDFQELVKRLNLLDEQTSLRQNISLNPAITEVSAIDQAQVGAIAFIEGSALAHWVSKTQASALILPQDTELKTVADERAIAWISTDQPRLLFAQVLGLFYQPWRPAPNIHATAVIDPSAKIGKDVAIGANVIIQAGAVIGNEVCLYPNVVIYPQAQIGDRTVLHANCVIHERAVLGQNCVVHSGAVIGAEGFGFVPTATGWYKMPQSGRTVLEDGVEVGCNTAIDRPAVGETRIGQGTKIDNLVQIGHGCQVGQNCILVSQAGLAGAVQLGDRVIIAGQSGVTEKLKLGDHTIVTAKSAVFQDVAAGETVSGIPAMPNKLWLRTSVLIRRLPELLRHSSQHLVSNSSPKTNPGDGEIYPPIPPI
jgi:UDP-3-O-[3-hydroxymyristoyl] glucosamine N-acyltransferase